MSKFEITEINTQTLIKEDEDEIAYYREVIESKKQEVKFCEEEVVMYQKLLADLKKVEK